jgi:PAS domain S-box-containing protein/diguanylate cyclase (GGDEF)-like protein
MSRGVVRPDEGIAVVIGAVPGTIRPGRVAFLTRNEGVVEATVALSDGQTLASYLAGCGEVIEGTDGTWLSSSATVKRLTLRPADITWARLLEDGAPSAVAAPDGREDVAVEVVLADGSSVHGRFRMIPDESIQKFLDAAGVFPVLRRARVPSDPVSLGDLALNQSCIRSVRDITPRSMRQEWRCPAPGAEGRPVVIHWLVRAARKLQFAGCETLSIPPSAPVVSVWREICATAGMTEDDLAVALGRHLRLNVVDAAVVEAAGDFGVPQSLMERYGVRAVATDGRTLTIATADPLDANAEQAISFACNRSIDFVIATPRALRLEAPAPPEPELEALLRDVTQDAADAVRIEDEPEPQEIEVEEATAEPIVRLANQILREAVRQGASDIHLEPDGDRGIVRLRVDGMLRPFMQVPLRALQRVISRYKVVARLDIADRVRPQDGRVRVRVDGRSYELRLSTVPTQDAEKAVIRVAGSVHEQTLEQLEMPQHELLRLRHLLSFRDGIIVVTGPTGSGKTTTLYGALSELNTGEVNIMTVEDPIERALPGVTQMQVQPRRGVTFASALRAILRQDPDVILLGEIRDLESAEIAVQAATTGHLVLTTLHTTSAVGVVARLRDLGLDPSSLAGSLRGVVAQRLARRTCDRCSGAGCEQCGSTGFRGRVPLMEVLCATPRFNELIGRGALFHELQRAAEQDGMRPMSEVATEAVANGLTTQEEIGRVIGDIEHEAKTQAAFARSNGVLPDAPPVHLLAEGDVVDAVLLPSGPVSEKSGLPARLVPMAGPETTASRRGDAMKALLQGLDRCVADNQSTGEVLHFACEQLASAFGWGLVWIATMEDGALEIRGRAGPCSPYVRDLLPDWEDLESSQGTVATAVRTGAPQGGRLDDEPGFESWRVHAREHSLPIFIVIPMVREGETVGVIGLHARSWMGLDRQAGNELLNLGDRIASVLERLRQLEAADLQLSALELAADSVFTTDPQGVIQWVNRSFTELSGFTAAEAIGQTPHILRSDRQDSAFFTDLWDTIRAGRAWRGELYNRRKDGTLYAVEQTITPVVDARGVVSRFLAVQRDITERKRREESVRQLVTSDVVTGLPNSRALEAELGGTIAAVAAGRPEATLLLVQIHGRADAGAPPDPADEALLRDVAKVLSDTLRPGDYLARLGEHEFAALLPETPQQGAVVAADRLRSAVSRMERAGEAQTPISIRIGIAAIDGTQSARATLALADNALYRGRESHEPVSVSQHVGQEPASRESAEWAERIRSALRDSQFFLHFQPVIRLGTRSLSHYDALLRLHDDEGNVVPARIFIDHAENLGLMPQIDRWVVEDVLRLLQTSPDLRVSLNLSAETVASEAFRQFLQRQSRRMTAFGDRIIFEVAEVAAMQDLPRVVDHMNRLRELGCRFALDNFSLTSVSMASLGTLPVDYVKLDGSLITGVDLDRGRQDLVRAFATVARALGKEVIAGCAERAAIVELLPSLGIDLAQGHYLGLPSPELRPHVTPPRVAFPTNGSHREHVGPPRQPAIHPAAARPNGAGHGPRIIASASPPIAL